MGTAAWTHISLQAALVHHLLIDLFNFLFTFQSESHQDTCLDLEIAPRHNVSIRREAEASLAASFQSLHGQHMRGTLPEAFRALSPYCCLQILMLE